MLHDMPQEGHWVNESLTQLVEAARSGDGDAWRRLCDRTKNVAWKTINSFTLGREDAEDAFAATFFRLAEKLDTIRDPEFLPGWLATTARNEVYSLIRSNRRIELYEELPESYGQVSDVAGERVIEAELSAALYRAFAAISERCQQLLRLLTTEPPLSYATVGDLLGIPQGSIGPTRGRCLEDLRRQPALRPYIEGL